jgi:hypothetical protein
MSAATVTELDIWRERWSWLHAARHLEQAGLPPCVPCGLVGWLHRHGIDSAWCIP